MKSFLGFYLIIFALLFASFIMFNSAEFYWEAKRLRQVLSQNMNLDTDVGERFLNRIRPSSIKLVKISFCQDTLLLSRLDDIQEYVEQGQIPSFLVILKGQESQILVSSDVQSGLDFCKIGNYQVSPRSISVDLFYHLSNPTGWEQYYVYDPSGCKFYSTPKFEYGEKILPESINLENNTFRYITSSSDELHLGNLHLWE